jgi:hypothetical protein
MDFSFEFRHSSAVPVPFALYLIRSDIQALDVSMAKKRSRDVDIHDTPVYSRRPCPLC